MTYRRLITITGCLSAFLLSVGWLALERPERSLVWSALAAVAWFCIPDLIEDEERDDG